MEESTPQCDNPWTMMKRFSCQNQPGFLHPAAAAQQFAPPWAGSAHSRRATKTYTSKEAFISLVNTIQSILSKVHEIWEHNQHSSLWEDARSITSIQRFLYLLYKHHFSETWIDICCRFLPCRAEHYTNTPCRFFLSCSFSFQPPQATAAIPPSGKQTSIFLSTHIKSYQT